MQAAVLQLAPQARVDLHQHIREKRDVEVRNSDGCVETYHNIGIGAPVVDLIDLAVFELHDGNRTEAIRVRLTAEVTGSEAPEPALFIFNISTAAVLQKNLLDDLLVAVKIFWQASPHKHRGKSLGEYAEVGFSVEALPEVCFLFLRELRGSIERNRCNHVSSLSGKGPGVENRGPKELVRLRGFQRYDVAQTSDASENSSRTTRAPR